MGGCFIYPPFPPPCERRGRRKTSQSLLENQSPLPTLQTPRGRGGGAGGHSGHTANNGHKTKRFWSKMKKKIRHQVATFGHFWPTSLPWEVWSQKNPTGSSEFKRCPMPAWQCVSAADWCDISGPPCRFPTQQHGGDRAWAPRGPGGQAVRRCTSRRRTAAPTAATRPPPRPGHLLGTPMGWGGTLLRGASHSSAMRQKIISVAHVAPTKKFAAVLRRAWCGTATALARAAGQQFGIRVAWHVQRTKQKLRRGARSYKKQHSAEGKNVVWHANEKAWSPAGR